MILLHLKNGATVLGDTHGTPDRGHWTALYSYYTDNNRVNALKDPSLGSILRDIFKVNKSRTRRYPSVSYVVSTPELDIPNVLIPGQKQPSHLNNHSAW